MPVSEMSLASEHVQRLLQCAICLEQFKQPKLLPCQHTFCLTPCLEGLVDRRTRSIRCPECRADHFVPRNGASSFPNNLTIIGFLELSGAGGQAIENMGRSENGPLPSQREPPQAQRAASPPYIPEDAAGAESGGCNVCHNEGRLTRCCHCDQLVCEVCRRNHMDQVRTDVARMINQMRRGLPQISEQIITIGRKGTQLQNNCECVREEISDAVEKHIRELKSRERTLREDVDTFLSHELRNLRTHQENAEVEIASLTSFCDSTESVLSMTRPIPDGDLMEMKGQCLENLETVQCYEDGTIRPPNVKQIQASLESTFLTSTINNFGDLIITSRTTQAHTAHRQASGEEAARRTEPIARTRASVPHQLEPPVNRNIEGLHQEARASSVSPVVLRRRQAHTSRTSRPTQVHFDEEETPVDNSRWGALVQNMRPNRRTREERRSDTRISSLAGGRSPTLIQQMRDRTRHRSLGALPATNEYSVEEESEEQDLGPQSGQAYVRGGQDERYDFGGAQPAMSTGARSQRLPQSTQQNADPESSDDEQGSGQPFMGNSPSIYVNSPRNKYNQKGSAIKQFGKRGSETASFTWPRGVAASPMDDKIYVADSSNHRVQVFDNTGRFIKTFGQYGQGPGEFDCLAGIAINGLGQVIIADRYNHRVQVFDRNGHFQSAFGSEGSGEGQLNYPWGVACDNMGFIYVCDKENHRLQVFQSNGTFVRMFGEFGSRIGQFENPHYVAVSADNKVYISDSSNHRVQVFSIYGDFLFSFGICGTLRGQMKFPRGIAIDNQGFVVIADSGNNRIQIFRADGRFYSMFGSWGSENGQFKGLEGLTILANGNIVVSDRENHRIQIF